ncbi:hypothetical protein O5833_27915, partial [Escherichia coli]|nr:hypothetical protein [Escherichia coli]
GYRRVWALLRRQAELDGIVQGAQNERQPVQSKYGVLGTGELNITTGGIVKARDTQIALNDKST